MINNGPHSQIAIGALKIAALAAILVGAVAGCCASVATIRSADPEQHAARSLDHLFTEKTQEIQNLMAERSWPGVAIAVVDRERTLWSGTFGLSDPVMGVAVTSQTIFNIGSVTKTVAATAVMMAVQDGLVDLDAPISQYLPEFTVNSPWEDRPEERITLRHLLNHTAGFTHEAPVGNNFNPASPSWSAHLASIPETWLKFPVGERYAYSNLGIEIASYIVQEVSGLPFEEFVRRRIFEPLGMNSSFVNTTIRNGNCGACATGHNRWFKKLPTYIPMQGAGGIRMNLEDASRYLQFHLNRGNVDGVQVLDSQYFLEMYRPSVQITTAEPLLRYGLGFSLWGNFADTYAVQHLGDGFGFSTAMRWYPEYGIGMVLFVNSVERGPDWDVGTSLLMDIIDADLIDKIDDSSVPDKNWFYEHVEATIRRHPLSRPSPTPYRDEWEKYVGTYCAVYGGAYELNSDVNTSSICHHVFEHDGYLYHRSGNQVSQRLFEYEEGLYFEEISGEALDFRNDSVTFRNIELR